MKVGTLKITLTNFRIPDKDNIIESLKPNYTLISESHGIDEEVRLFSYCVLIFKRLNKQELPHHELQRRKL